MLRHLIPHNTLSCEDTFITLHFIDKEMEADKSSECAQGYQARDSIRIQAQVHLFPLPMLLAAKTTKVPCTSNILALFKYCDIKKKKTVNSSEKYQKELGASLYPFPLSSSVIFVLGGTEHLTGFQVYCVSLCIGEHKI